MSNAPKKKAESTATLIRTYFGRLDGSIPSSPPPPPSTYPKKEPSGTIPASPPVPERPVGEVKGG